MTVIDYYDGFRDRLLTDYREGNARVEAALTFAKEALAGAREILDVGCGIGWTSAEMSTSGARVTGIDISLVLITAAREMFGECCAFVEADFIEAQFNHVYDGVLMVDVYEHFPREARPQVHAQIARVLGDRLALTVPTPEALRYARENDIPLQPIDEEVTDEDVQRLAEDIGGHVEVNRLVSIWRDEDYRHVLVTR